MFVGGEGLICADPPTSSETQPNCERWANQKSPTGANPAWCYGGYGPPGSPNCNPSNEYNPQLTKAGLQSFPLPSAAQLTTLTQTVMANDNFSYAESASEAAVMAAVRRGVKHVIFIIKENRTYDQVLGDLANGSNGDPRLTEFGEAITPNEHALAQQFVTLDNFMDTAEVSYDGWAWSTSAQAPDVVEHQYPVAYAYRGTSLDSDGENREVNVGIPAVPTGTWQGDVAARQAADPFTSSDPDVLPGQTDVAAPDGPDHELNTGYLWNSAMRAGLSVRNYGFFVDTTRYTTTDFAIPVLRDPFASATTVAYPDECRAQPVHRSIFPRLRQLTTGLLAVRGMGAGLRCTIRGLPKSGKQRGGSAGVVASSFDARPHR